MENPALAKVLAEVRLDLEHGSSLSVACSKHPKVFSHLFCTLVQAGEIGGNLDEVLGSLAKTIEKQAQLNRTIRSAMTYPAVVLSVMVVIFTAMIVFIVPCSKICSRPWVGSSRFRPRCSSRCPTSSRVPGCC